MLAPAPRSVSRWIALRVSPRKSLLSLLMTLAASLALVRAASAAAISVVDDSGATVTLDAPAHRIVSLAPHTTELVYAAGGADLIVGAVNYSDYPPAARQLPRVGDNQALDLEKIAAFKPDLLIVWRHGNAQRQIGALRALGIPMFFSEPKQLPDIAANLHKLGELMGTVPTADKAAQDFSAKIARLRGQYARRPVVSVFYQVWETPLMTLNGDHMVSDVMRLCGGRNVFASLTPVAPTVSTEAVVAANPDAIVTGRYGDADPAALPKSLDRWKSWTELTAVSHRNLFAVNADWLDRPAPRLADGAAQLCEALQTAREHLGR
ncbi:Vitamin B12-binding protein [Pararobbsia alpina]|uniref:Vitamin B12-binding protein n=2 Tax=Pararobbsia alpina TaxID=621374 RepID=A0A6S7AS75_9BURK|nr:Vitamin B12-binding protein [Pararobbsia alpina]